MGWGHGNIGGKENTKDLAPQVTNLTLKAGYEKIDVSFTGVEIEWINLVEYYRIVIKANELPSTPTDGTWIDIQETSSTGNTVYNSSFTELTNSIEYGVRIYVKGINGWQTSPEEQGYATPIAFSSILSENTPEEILIAAQSGQAANFWSVGDAIPITLNGTVGVLAFNETYQAFILGFNHNNEKENNNTIHFQFGKTTNGVNIAFCDDAYGVTGSTSAFRMNTSNTNSGGWDSSYMRTTICPAFLKVLPIEWQNIIKSCTKYTDNTGTASDTASYVTASSDKIWLLSEFEVFGTRTQANSAEQNYQQQYDYYKNGNSKLKYQHNSTSTACLYWLRSPAKASENSTVWCIINANAVANRAGAYYSRGFAPGFMVG